MGDHGMEKKEDHQPPAEHSEKAGNAQSPEVTPNEQVLHSTNDDTTTSPDTDDTPENDNDTREVGAEAESQAGAAKDEAESEGEEAAPSHTHTDETNSSETQPEAPRSARESLDSTSTDSSGSDGSRRTSRRTEELIQAAARDIVGQVEADRGRESMNTETDESLISESEGYSGRSSEAHATAETCGRESLGSELESEYAEGGVDESSVSQSRPASARPSDAHSVGQSVHSPRQSTGSSRESDTRRSSTARSHHSTEDERSSSRNEENDDVFSDHSPRSSMGSLSESEHKKLEKMADMDHSPRISDLSQYDHDEEFVPTVRGAPRPVFRSPSSVKAMQMSSPTPSVYGSPRSGRRGMPTVSRLGSPSLSAQYSPKKTPPRFKRNTPPLVLLHVTLLPLRWGWGDVLERASPDDLSPDAKAVRDAWRLLQDRMGDTTVERGILLPHPQNDYEVLEERLLEALELPCRRRARILECGHYLGPSNEMTLIEDSDSEEDDDYDDEDRRGSRRSVEHVHWCKTCRSEIRYDALGPAKIFRVKVYASNGLMKAGAWEACWKEMERVDVELEPLVDGVIQEEMNRLELEQEQETDMEMREEYDEDYGVPEEEYSDEEELEEDIGAEKEAEMPEDRELPDDDLSDELPKHRARSEDLPEEMQQDEDLPDEVHAEGPDGEDYAGNRDASFVDHDSASRIPTPEPHVETPEDRERRDGERLREMYGHDAPREHDSAQPHDEQTRSASPRETGKEVKNDSLPDLLVQSGRVLMHDKKNVIIGLLSILILMLAVRGGNQSQSDPRTFQTLVVNQEMATVTVTHVPTQDVQLMTTQAQPGPMAEESHVIQPDTRDDAKVEVEMEGLVPDSPTEEEEEEDEAEEEELGDIPSTEETRESLMSEVSEDEQGVAIVGESTSHAKGIQVNENSLTGLGLLDASDSSSDSENRCGSCSHSSDSELRGLEATATKQPSEEVSKAPESIREIETVISERIVRVVETVTEVETATIKVTETVSLPTQSVEPGTEVDIVTESEVEMDSNTEIDVKSDADNELQPQAFASASTETALEPLVLKEASEESDEVDSEDQPEGILAASIEAPTEAPVEQHNEDHVEEADSEPTAEISDNLEDDVVDADAVESETHDDDDDLESESVPEREL